MERQFREMVKLGLLLAMLIALTSDISRKSLSYAARLSSSGVIGAKELGVGALWDYHSHSSQFADPSSPVSDAASMFDIHRVAIVHRHGDRSQIKPSLGPVLEDSSSLREFWNSRLPDPATESLLDSVANIELHHAEAGTGLKTPKQGTPRDRILIGHDVGSHPFGMLTNRGVNQLVNVGSLLRQRYQLLLQNNGTSLYVRTTNYCRTQLSVRSLLLGLLDKHNTNTVPSDEDRITVFTRPRAKETLVHPVDGACHMWEHRSLTVAEEHTLPTTLTWYDGFKGNMEQILAGKAVFDSKAVFQFPTQTHSCSHVAENQNNNSNQSCVASSPSSAPPLTLEWPDVKEVITCHFEHNSGLLPEQITADTVTKSTEIASHVWREKYSDKLMMKFGLGRFLIELFDDLTVGLMQSSSESPASNHQQPRSDSVRATNPQARMLIYSAHDYTVYALLMALGFDSAFWPPYASHVAIELATRRNPDHQQNHIRRDIFNEPVTMPELWARVLFNNKILLPDVPLISEDEEARNQGWVPLSSLFQKLEESSLTEDEYNKGCIP